VVLAVGPPDYQYHKIFFFPLSVLSTTCASTADLGVPTAHRSKANGLESGRKIVKPTNFAKAVTISFPLLGKSIIQLQLRDFLPAKLGKP